MGHDRRDGRGARAPAVPARPRRLPVHPPLPRPVRHRRVRAQRQADGTVGASRPTASPSSGRTGTTSRRSSPRPGCACRPSSRSASRTTCGPPESFTPDSNFQLGFVPEVARAVRRGRAQLAGDHLRAGRRAGRRGVDRRRPPDDGPRRGRCRADGSVGDPAALAARADGRVARRPVRDALAGQAAGDRAWPAPAAARTTPIGRRARRSGRPAAGSGRCGSSRASSSRRSATRSRDPSWFPAVRDEVRATREAVALYDLTTYAKFLVAGPGALAGLQRLATSDLDTDVGRIVYTVLANERGGIELDPTITRLDDDDVPRPGTDADAAALRGRCCGTACRRTRSSPT